MENGAGTAGLVRRLGEGSRLCFSLWFGLHPWGEATSSCLFKVWGWASLRCLGAAGRAVWLPLVSPWHRLCRPLHHLASLLCR